MMERYRVVSRAAAVGIVIERTGWEFARAESWLAAQVALGAIKPELHRNWPPYRLAELEGALSAREQHTAPPVALPARRINRVSVRAWLAERYAEPGAEPTELQDVAAAQQKFPSITRAVVREERRKLLDPEQLKPGRRRNCAEK